MPLMNQGYREDDLAKLTEAGEAMPADTVVWYQVKKCKGGGAQCQYADCGLTVYYRRTVEHVRRGVVQIELVGKHDTEPRTQVLYVPPSLAVHDEICRMAAEKFTPSQIQLALHSKFVGAGELPSLDTSIVPTQSDISEISKSHRRRLRQPGLCHTKPLPPHAPRLCAPGLAMLTATYGPACRLRLMLAALPDRAHRCARLSALAPT